MPYRPPPPRPTRRSLLLAAAAATLAGGPAWAQALADLAALSGPDRIARLVEGAKREGRLTLYTATPVDDVREVMDGFTKAYGVPVTLWRGSSEDVLRRAVTEIKAGRHDVDVVETNGPELEALVREKVLQPVRSTVTADIFPQAVPEHGAWIGSRLNIITAAYNSDRVPTAEVPRSWNDLLDPRWKGRIAIESEAYDWLATVLDSFPSKEEGLAFFRKLATTNRPLLQKGHPQIANMVASGEVLIALQVYRYRVSQLESEGAPIRALSIGPSLARINGLGVARTSTRPNAALLYQNYTLTEAQPILAARHFTPTNTKLVPLPAGLDLRVIRPTVMLDDLATWRGTFERTFR